MNMDPDKQVPINLVYALIWQLGESCRKKVLKKIACKLKMQLSMQLVFSS